MSGPFENVNTIPVTIFPDSQRQRGDTEQIINVTDLLCEGPVKGLVKEEAGVYLNDSPVVDAEFEGVYSTDAATGLPPTIVFTGSSTTGTVSNVDLPTLSDPQNRVLQLEDYYKATGITAAIDDNLSTPAVTLLQLSGGSNFTTAWDTISTNQSAILFTEGVELYGTFVRTSSTTGTFKYYGDLNDSGFDSSKTYTLSIRKGFYVESVSENSITVQFAAPAAGTYSFKLRNESTIEAPTFFGYPELDSFNKVDNLKVNFVDGSLYQNALPEVNGVGGAVSRTGELQDLNLVELKQLQSDTATTQGITLLDSAGYPEGQNSNTNGAEDVTIIPSSAFGLDTASLVAQADELRFTVQYPSLQTINLERGEKEAAYAYYEVKIFTDDQKQEVSWDSGTNCFANYGKYIVHYGNTNAPVSFDHIISLDQFRPFENFEIRIARITRHVGLPVTSDGTAGGRTNKNKWQLSAQAQISAVSSVIKDKFRYPYSSIASVTFSSKKFNGVPKRSYLMEGLKVRIPDTYTPREYSDTGVAKYEGFWGGNFKEELFYTDNPAWIFYDIVTNNRYGAGQYISESDIDKYALYRIAKYCDDLVPDGKGGTEPRFRANLYLTKATDVYKILKDMASLFTGMLYWLDGKITVIQDTPADPVYTFTKGNVIGGQFSYESTGTKTRPNQIVVTWNDPTINYEPSPLIVEDREDIVRKGKIISENAVAFGATSEGQAIRYGRWKLFTALKQTEVVSFKTALAGMYLRPGDIINIQDADRYAVSYSGRVASYTPGTLRLDREVNFNAESSYELSTLVTDSAAFYAGYDETTYTRGERIEEAYVNGQLVALDTEARASNAFFDAAETQPIEITWQEYTYVQTKSFDAGVLSSVTNTISTTLDSPVSSDTIWALRETSQGLNVLGSAKEYKILSISKDSETEFSISAVEHFASKFDAVDTDYELGQLPNSIYPEREPEVVPAPRNIYVVLNTDSKRPGEELTVRWDKIENFDYLAGYELLHNVPGLPNPLSTTTTSYSFTELANDVYNFKVRGVSTKGNKSKYISLNYVVEDPYEDNITRMPLGIPKGAISNSTAVITGDPGAQSYSFEIIPTAIASVGDSFFPAELTSSSLSLAGIGAEDYYALLDYNDSAIKLVQYDTTTLTTPFWRDVGDGSALVSDSFQSITGTVSVLAGSNTLTGSGTSFTTELALRDTINLSDSNNPSAPGLSATVIAIVSNTKVILDTSFTSDISGITAYRTLYRPDYASDAIFARIFGSSSGDGIVANVENFLTIDPGLSRRALFIDTDTAFLTYDAENLQTNIPSEITIQVTSINFRDPEYNVEFTSGFDGTGTGTGVYVSGDESPPLGAYSIDSNGVLTYTIDADGAIEYDSNSAQTVTVIAREKENTSTFVQKTLTIPKIKDGAVGTGAKTVILELEDYSIVYDADGQNPAFNDSSGVAGDITITATASPAFVNPLFRFTIDGTVGSWTSSADNTSTATYTVPADISSWGDGSGGTRVIKVEVAEEPASWDPAVPSTDPTEIEASDSASLLAVQIGKGGLAVSVPNSTHSLTANEEGIVSSNVGSGTTIEVFVGGVGIDYVDSNPQVGQWTVSVTSNSGGTDITPGNITASGTNPIIANVADHTFSTENALDDQESLVYTITVPQGAGLPDLTALAVQTFSLAKGAAASTSSALVFLYAASSSQPAEIGAGFPDVTVDLTTGLITGYTNPSTDNAAVTNWYDSANGAAAGASSTDKIWVVAATGNETESTDTIEFGEWTTPVQFTGIDGFNKATIELYQLSTDGTNAPADPTQGLIYTFSPPNLSTTGINGWSESRPQASRAFPYVWRISAAAVSNIETDTIDTNDWSTAIVVDRFVEDGITLELNNDAETVGAETLDTALSGLSISTTASVFQAGTDITSEWNFSQSSTAGITVSQNVNTFTVTALTGAFRSGNVTITATPKAGGNYETAESRSVNFTVTKVANGQNGVSYRINPSSGVVSYDPNTTTHTPTSVSFSATKVTPTGASSFTAGYWKLNGANQGQASSVSSGTISATSGNITAELYLDSGYTQLVDTESVPIVSSGENGEDGADGADGADSTVPGADGDSVGRVATGLVYYSLKVDEDENGNYSSFNPTATSFNFDTFSFPVLSTNWSLNAPTFNPENGKVYLYSRFTVTESTSGSPATGTGTGTPTFSAAAPTIGFEGLVTFSGSELSWDNGNQTFNYTAIDGANITTGAIQSANYTDNLSSDFSSSGAKFDLVNEVIETPHFYSNPTGAGFNGQVTIEGTSDVTGTLTVGSGAGGSVTLNGGSTQTIVISDGGTPRVILGKLS